MMTKKWAASHGICIEDNVPPVAAYCEPCARSPQQVAIRTIILHGVAAIGFGIDSVAVVDWLKDQDIWKHVSPNERKFLKSPAPAEHEKTQAAWRCEGEWALLWAIGRVESLGLPIRTCDTARLVDEIMPALDSDVSEFVASAKLRGPAELLAEEDRIYNLHSYARIDRKKGLAPTDLNWDVLYERHYAFNWLSGQAEWDDITCDT